MTLYRACEIYIDMMHGNENAATDVSDAMRIIEEHTGKHCNIFDAMKWCEDYLATHEGSPMRTEREIREKIKEYKEMLDDAECFSDEFFEYRHIIDLLRWVLKEDEE